jgi:hypothetical protein
MALQTSGPISLANIIDEFNVTPGPNGIGLTAFYRGGLIVPNTFDNAGIPTEGTISIRDFYGASSEPPKK